MADRPIIFSMPMVKALLEGRKTMTRRTRKLKEQPVRDDAGIWRWKDCQWPDGGGFPESGVWRHAPWKPGDVLWVKERCAFAPVYTSGGKKDRLFYEADGQDSFLMGYGEDGQEIRLSLDAFWQSSMYMPKACARIFLDVKSVRMERLQDITEEDAAAEGVCREIRQVEGQSARDRFREVWDRLRPRDERKKFLWDANPWVWVIRFERTEKPPGWADWWETDGIETD